MSTRPEAEVFVTFGVDTHKHTHLAVALDQLGRRLDELEIPTTTAGFGELYAWASELGTIDTVGIEGTALRGSDGHPEAGNGQCRDDPRSADRTPFLRSSHAISPATSCTR